MKIKTRILIVSAIALICLAARFVWLFYQSDVNLPQKIIKEQLWKQGFQIDYADFKVDLSFIPTVEITQASLRRHDQENASILAEVGRLYIDFELLPFLLQGKFSLDELEVEKAKIYIHRDSSGANNWFPQQQGGGHSKKPGFQLKASYLSDVSIFYSGPTFVNKKLKINEASLTYSKKDQLVIEQASGKYEQDIFLLEGRIDSLIDFLSGKGTPLQFKLNLTEKDMLVELDGEINAKSLPSMEGVKVFAKGKDISDLRVYLPLIPEVKTDEFKFDGVIKTQDENYFLSFEDVLLRCQTNVLGFSGSLTFIDKELSYDLSVNGKGSEFSALSACSSIVASQETYILFSENLEIDFYQFEGRLAGNNQQMKLADMKIDTQSNLDILRLELNSLDIKNFSKTSAKVFLSGKNVQDVFRRAAHWYQPKFDVPDSDSYRATFNFFLDGDWEELEVYEADVELMKEDQYVKLVQEEKSIARIESWKFRLEGKGNNVAHWYPVYEEFHVPEMLAYEVEANVFHEGKAWGFDDANMKFSRGENNLSIKGSLLFENEIKDMNLDFALEGQESDFVALVSHEENSAFDYAVSSDTRLSGKLSGNLKTFSINQFLYEGKRGKLDGDIDVVLDERKKVDARFADVNWMLELDRENKPTDPALKEQDISLEWMDNLDLNLSYEHFSLNLNDAEFKLGPSKLVMQDGKLDRPSFSLAYLETEVLGSLLIDAKSDSYALGLDVSNLDFGHLLKELEWFDDLQGKGYFKFSLDSSGKNLDALFANMKGAGKFYISNGKVKDFGNTSTSYIRASMPWRKNMADLEMDCFMSRLFIENGMLRTRKLYLSNRNMYLMGGGTLDLSTYKLDMAFSPRAHSANFFDANISLFLDGDINNPQVKVGKLSAVSDVGLKYGQWALLGPLALAIPKLPVNKPPSCQVAMDALLAD